MALVMLVQRSMNSPRAGDDFFHFFGQDNSMPEVSRRYKSMDAGWGE